MSNILDYYVARHFRVFSPNKDYFPHLIRDCANKIPLFFAATLISISFGTGFASAEAFPLTGCIPPAVPILPTDPDFAQEYRTELNREYDDYFRYGAEYLNCLHDAEMLTREQINQAIEEYTKFLNGGQE